MRPTSINCGGASAPAKLLDYGVQIVLLWGIRSCTLYDVWSNSLLLNEKGLFLYHYAFVPMAICNYGNGVLFNVPERSENMSVAYLSSVLYGSVFQPANICQVFVQYVGGMRQVVA